MLIVSMVVPCIIVAVLTMAGFRKSAIVISAIFMVWLINVFATLISLDHTYEMWNHCRFCGTSLVDKYCSDCGKKSDGVFLRQRACCAECGALKEFASLYCSSCGKKYEAVQRIVSEPEALSKFFMPFPVIKWINSVWTVLGIVGIINTIFLIGNINIR